MCDIRAPFSKMAANLVFVTEISVHFYVFGYYVKLRGPFIDIHSRLGDVRGVLPLIFQFSDAFHNSNFIFFNFR